jgi:hypothetical protein
MRENKCLNQLVKNFLKPSSVLNVILDDESYFTVDGNVGGDGCLENGFYFLYEGLEVPENVKFKPISKFLEKVLVWLAIREKGRSFPFILESGNAIDAKRFVDNCLKLKLKKFIDKYHSGQKYFFWPDLAPEHYANDTMNAYEMLGIKVLPKDQNPPNVA